MPNKLIKILDGSSQNLPSTGSEQLKAGRIFITTDFPNEAIYYCPEDGRIIQLSSGIGKRTLEGGEIFNDYINNKALSRYSHAEGSNTIASGQGAHAEGWFTVASNLAAHAGGIWTIANSEGQTAIGIYNDNKTVTLFEVGNGTAEALRSNAFEVYKDGHVEVQTQGQTDNSVVIKSTLDNLKNELILTDNTTGVEYKLYVNNGKLILGEVSE